MISPENFVTTLQNSGISYFVGVPDSLLADFCAYVEDNFDSNSNITAANEWNAIAIASWYNLATGKIPLVYMQNSGLGNTVNPILSLIDKEVYNIPMLIMIGWRGEPEVKDEPQHVKQGRITPELLDTMEIKYEVIDQESDEKIAEVIEKATAYMNETEKPFALLVRKWTFEKYKLQSSSSSLEYELSREDAVKVVIDTIPEKSVTVGTTGKLSRELFEYREELGQTHEKDFLTVWCMGHSSQIALWIALQKSNTPIYCLDWDSALIMHMGGLGIIGNLKPKNYVHIVFNNGAHESVGWQKTVGFHMDFVSIARACGYENSLCVETKQELISELENINPLHWPTFLEIKVAMNSRKDLGRPTIGPKENKIDFMKYLQQ